jgi:excisionase family DNA binding protein
MNLDRDLAVSPRFVTIKEAARYLGSGETFVKERIRAGDLESVQLGAGRRVVFTSLIALGDRLVAEHRAAG